MKRLWAVRALFVASSMALALSCGAGDSSVGGGGAGGGKGTDAGSGGGAGGGGGVSGCNPLPEICDGIDNDCNGIVDDLDQDKDGFSACDPANPDCDDNDPSIHPGASEGTAPDGKDNDCDGVIDDHIPGVDHDGDGTPYPQDCDDNNANVGPNAVEVVGDKVDNNCNGQVDEATTCEASITGSTAQDFLKAMELCTPVISASFDYGDTTARNIRPKFGSNVVPKAGSKFIFMSSGTAVDNVSQAPLGDSTYSPQPGMEFYSTGGGQNDLTQLTVTLKVPQNAKSLAFDFSFFSAEFPEWVGSSFNDKFVAELTSSALPSTFSSATCVGGGTGCRKGNISFDGAGNPIEVNNNYFIVCKKTSDSKTSKCGTDYSSLNGTGYEVSDGTNGLVGGGTGWLHTEAPVTPGETIKLVFRVYDEGDYQLDSAVLIDNFVWGGVPVTGPSTSPIN